MTPYSKPPTPTGAKSAEACNHCHEPIAGKQHCPKNPDCHWQQCSACGYMNDLATKTAWKDTPR